LKGKREEDDDEDEIKAPSCIFPRKLAKIQ
jgi:hypothetical protein